MHEDLIKRIREKLKLPKNHSTLVKKAQIIQYICQINLQNKVMFYHLNKSEQNKKISLNKLQTKQKQLQQVEALLLTYQIQYQRQNKQNQILKEKVKFIQEYIQKCHMQINSLEDKNKQQVVAKKQKIIHSLSDLNQFQKSNDNENAIIQLMKGFKGFMKKNNNDEQEQLSLTSKHQMQNSSPTFFSQSNKFINLNQKITLQELQSSLEYDQNQIEEGKQNFQKAKQKPTLYQKQKSDISQQSIQSQTKEIIKDQKKQQNENINQQKLDIMSIFGAFGTKKNN